MSALKENTKKEENDKPISETSGPLTSKPAFSNEGNALEESMQHPHENMTPNSDQADLLKHVSYIDSISADGPAKAAYVNGSASPSISQEILLDISKSTHTKNSTDTTTIQLEDCDPLRKDGEIAVRQIVTAEDVENRGIWGFDADSPENSLDKFDGGEKLEWNPQKEFMNFLLEDQDCSETEARPASSRRKCSRSDKVASTENSKNDHTMEGSPKAVEPESKQSKSRSSTSNKSQYSNGTLVAFKQFLQKPANIRKTSQKLEFVRENLSRDSGLEEEPALFSSNSNFKDKSPSQIHAPNWLDQKPFICKECGRDFYSHTSLLKHINVHRTKRQQFLKCPQCTFGTYCPNTFVQHAKTHEKDKRYYPCHKCNFLAASKPDLVSHMLNEHPVSNAQRAIIGRQNVQKDGKSDSKPNSVRNYKSPDKNLQFSENSNCSFSLDCESLEVEDSNGLLQTDQPKSKHAADDKSDKSESKLDKSIHSLLSRKRNRDSESKCTPTFDETGIGGESPDAGKCYNDESLNAEDGPPSPVKGKGNQFALNDDDSVCTQISDGSGHGFGHKSDCSKGQNSSTNHKHLPSEKLTLKKSPSKRKMSTPFHNIQGQDILIDFPKCRQIFQKNSNLYLIKKCDSKDGLRISNAKFRSPCASSDLSEQEPGLLQTVSIKEECMEMEVCTNEPDNVVKIRDYKVELKSCPYCPAVFQSGIGLSNHIRGHLHRVGVSYKARHVVSAAQVASQDKVPPVRRRMAAIPQIKTEVDLVSIEQPSGAKSELTCPLCREWFDTKTGLSNHVRGHLKRLGKPCSTSTSKSPVIILKELMRDKKQFQVKLQALEKKCRSRTSLYPLKLSNGLIISTAKVQRFAQGGKRHGHNFSRSAEEKKRTEREKDPMKGSPSSDLIGILKKRRAHEEAKMKTLPQTARKALLVNAVKERDPSAQIPNAVSVSEKSDLNRKVCVHCNATFHSGVSLSNHLRAYARRKRNALLEGTTYDCKRKQRSRSGSKKKTHPLLHTPEEIYRLTCRFCDLVFQGPLSVQEDWVKHLQRHIMNTAVPHTGAAMVEVTCVPSEASTHTPPETSP